MNRLVSAATFLALVGVCAPSPAHASIISPIDPVIGVRGAGSGSPDITDGSAFALSPCTDPVLDGFFCAPYFNNLEGQITSLDLSFWDENGLPIPNTNGDGSNYFVSEVSDFNLLLNLNDGFTVRLCDGSTFAGQSACGFIVEITEFFLLTAIDPGGDLNVYSNVDGFVSVRGVNTIPNSNLPANDQPIPEPGSVLLFGIGAAAFAHRRLRRRAAQARAFRAHRPVIDSKRAGSVPLPARGIWDRRPGA